MNSATLFGATVNSPATGDVYEAAAIIFTAIAAIWAIKKVISLGNKS